MRKIGLDIGDPINRESGQISPTANPDLAGQVAWVRINFMRGPWPSPDDPGWQAAYDDIVNRYVARGIQVYGLIGHDAVLESAGSLFQDDPPNNAQVPQALAWIETYVRNFVSVAEHFQGRVRWFESFNEPNNWHDGRPWVTPYWFAKMLADIYRAVKLDRHLDVTLVSGPILSHNNDNVENEYSIGARYLLDTFRAGKSNHGWEDIRAASSSGSYPLDGVGFHLYVDQGPEKSADDIAATIRTYVDSIFRIMTQQDGLASQKKIYVSEVGWQSLVGEEKQAQNLQVALNTLRNDPRIGAAVWFSTQDFTPNGFGVFRPGLGPGDAKPAYQMLENIAAAEPVEPVTPVADGFQFPVGKAGRKVSDDYKVAAFFLDNDYYLEYNGAWHPGEDWNGRGGGDTDLGDPVYSVAHGQVVASDYYTPSWGNIVVIEHHLTNGQVVWSQYAHLRERPVKAGDIVSRGQQIGSIGKGEMDKWPAHLHFEIRTKDIPPDTWNVHDRAWVMSNYTNPTPFINSNLAENVVYNPVVVGEEIIVDSENGDPAAGLFTKADSLHWWSAPHGFRSSTLWTYASRVQEENWGEWRPNLPAAGRYQVFAFIPRDHATTRRAHYQVNHSGGQEQVIKDQSPYFDQWVSLGIYSFAAGNAGYLKLSDVTGETWGQRREVAFDAAKWVRILNA